MKIGQFFAGLLGGTALGMLFAKKEGKKIRASLKGKNPEEIAEIMGKEFIDLGKNITDGVKDIASSEEVQDLVSEGAIKAEKIKKQAEKEIRKSLPKIKKAAMKKGKEIKKSTVKKGKEVLKDLKKKVKK